VYNPVSVRTWGIIALLMSGVIASACQKELGQQARRPTIRIAQAEDRLKNPLTDALKRTLREHFPVEIVSVTPRSLTNNARSIEENEVELAVIPANVAYLAYTQGWDDLHQPHKKLRGLAVLDTIPLHLIARDNSGISKLSDIRGKRVAIGRKGSTTAVTAEMILESLRLSPADVHAEWISGDAAVEGLQAAKLDAVFNRGNDQEFAVEEVIQKLLAVKGTRFIPILRSETEKIRSTHPFLRPISVPAGMYGHHSEVETIGVDSLMVCRDDLPEELVYWITRTLVELRSTVAHSTHVDPERVHATPIPLHSGAARYYRERELFH
jgi:TRAP transporter TAXI family solute receptor